MSAEQWQQFAWGFVMLARVGEGHLYHNTRGGQRTAPGVGPCLLLCLRQGLIVILRVYSRLAAAPRNSPLLPSHWWGPGMTDSPHPCLAFLWVLGIQTQVVCLSQQSLHPLGPLQPILVPPPLRLTVPKHWRPSAISVLRSPEGDSDADRG